MSKNQNNATAEKHHKPWPADCLWPEPLWDGNGDSLNISCSGKH